MRVAFLSSLDPNNINHWSGTLYFIFQSLGQSHEVEWIGGDLIEEVRGEHSRRKTATPFIPGLYSRWFAKMISEILAEYDRFDVIVARDCFFIAYLEVDIPIVYIGDTTFDLIKESWGITHDNTIRLLDEIEGKAFLNADCIIFSSQWAKENATTHYGANPALIEVVEFGANMTKVPETGDIQIQEETLCNLLFIYGMKYGYQINLIKMPLIIPKVYMKNQNENIYNYAQTILMFPIVILPDILFVCLLITCLR